MKPAPSSRRRSCLARAVLLLFLMGSGHCAEPLIIEMYGMDGIESINAFDLFQESLGQDTEVQRKGFLEASFFEDQDVVLFLDRYGDGRAYATLIPYLNRLNRTWESEEESGTTASLLILLRDSDASVEAWRKIALDMPEDSKARRVSEEVLAYRIFQMHFQRLPYDSFLGLKQSRAPEEEKIPRDLPVEMQGPFPVLSEKNWRPMSEWYVPSRFAEKDGPWDYNPHWRSRMPDLEEAESRLGPLPATLPVRRFLEPSDYIGFGPPPDATGEVDPVTSEELDDYARFRTAPRTIISVAGRPLLVRIQYGRIPIYFMAGSEPFLNWHMARSENRTFLSFLLHAVAERNSSEPLKVTYIQRGLAPAEQVASQERSLVFLFFEEPWGIILGLFVLILFVFIWARFPHDRTPLQAQESGSRRFGEHFEALGSRMVRSRQRTKGLAPLIRYKKKESIDKVFPELEQNIKLKEETILSRVRKLWE